jgi:hypothetical protein
MPSFFKRFRHTVDSGPVVDYCLFYLLLPFQKKDALMAQVRLTLREAEGRLPAVCMVCGEEATVTKTKKMSWCPPWVGVLILAGLLPYAIVASILTKRASVKAPFCDAHQGHWFNRLMINLGTLFVCGVIGGGGFLVIWWALSQPGRPNDGPGFACLLPVVMLVVWIIVLVILQQSAIRPQEITDREIVLTGICEDFVTAVEDRAEERLSARRRRRYEDDDEYDDPPPRKKKRRPVDDDDDAPPPRKKKRPPDDAFEE